MKRLAFLGLLASMGVLTGCPVWDDNGNPNGRCPECPPECPSGECTTTSTTLNGECYLQSECTGINEVCGSDNQCHTGDCTIWGCAQGLECRVGDDQKAHCLEPATGTGGTNTGGTNTGGTNTGGTNTGGTNTGGTNTGGTNTGGTNTGGTSTGGTNTGGSAGGTGGATGGSGGTMVPPVGGSGGTGGKGGTGGTGGGGAAP